jgi:hypothetical protein
MLRKASIRMGFVLVLVLLTGTVYAQGPGPKHSDPHWHASYWNNISLSDTPAREDTVTHIDFDWGYGSPHHTVAPEGFSARWKRYIDLVAGTYRFTATSDDGIRVYVDDRLIIDEWHDQPARTYSADVSLQPGHHLVTVEYYENTGAAVARLEWTRLSGTAKWRGEYYDNRWLSGSPVLTRDDEGIDFNWGYGSPAGHIPSDGFAVRWTRTARLESGLYRFTTTTDDGVRLWVNNHLLIDKWVDQASQSHSGTIHVPGDVPIKIEYYENGGAASARLTWTRIGDEPPPPPPTPGQVIVDDSDPGFAQGGSATGWHTTAGGYGGNLTWTKNNDRVRPRYNWARWYPDLESGCYEVFVYIPEHNSTTTNARYWISHYDGFALRQVNQAASGGSWVSLGTYQFRGQGGEYVSLSDVTYEPYLSRRISFDAVKWVPR